MRSPRLRAFGDVGGVGFSGPASARLQIDKRPDARYRATAGALVLCRTPDLQQLLRHAYRLGVCRSFREVLTALQQLSDWTAAGRQARPPGRRARAAAAPQQGAIGRRFWPVKLRPASGLVRWL